MAESDTFLVDGLPYKKLSWLQPDGTSTPPLRAYAYPDGSHALAVINDRKPRGKKLVPAGGGVWPVTTTANTSQMLLFPRTVTLLYIANMSTSVIYVDLDEQATLGSLQVAAISAGVPGSLSLDGPPVRRLHIYTTAATLIGGAATGGILVWGWP